MIVIAQHCLDTRDHSDRIAQAAFEGVFECIPCGQCTEVCPSHINIAELIGRMQKEADVALYQAKRNGITASPSMAWAWGGEAEPRKTIE